MRRGGESVLGMAPLTSAFIALNIVLFIISGMRSGGFVDIDPQVLRDLGGSMRELLWEGQWQRLIMPTFLHGGLLHIIFNTMALRSLGPSAEVYYGSANFGTLYVLSGVGGFCFSQMIGGYLSIGASCSIFGILGAMLAVEILRAPVLKYAWRNRAVQQQVMFLVLFLAVGFTGFMRMDNWGHLGGIFSGALLGGLFEYWRRRHRLPMVGVTAVFLVMVLLVALARWSFYSPYYHLHQGLLAEAENRPEQAHESFQEARRWARVWKDDRAVTVLLAAYQQRAIDLSDVRAQGYRGLVRRAKHLGLLN